MSAQAVWAPRALGPEGELERVRLRVEDGRIAGIAEGVEPRAGDDVHEDATLVPGLVDLQVNGGDGAAFDDPDPAARARAVGFHLRSGTTSLLATLVSAPLDRLEAALGRLAGEVDPAGPVLGIHLEGPFLAEAKAGAHERGALCDPTPERVERLLASARGRLALVTLAPERAGALEAVERLARAGAVVAAGHSLAELSTLRAAIARGLSFVTHVGNASDWPSRPFDDALGYRRSEPGMVGSFLVERRLRGSVILDGRHLHPELVRALVELRGAESVALVSDATAAAGLPPGRHRVGGLDLDLRAAGYATSAQGQGLAGSVIPLRAALAIAVREAGLSLATAVRMASATPADVIGASARKGRLAEGLDADLLLLGPDLDARAVYQRGARVGR